jgi:LEA14-like dessication related protein
MPKFISYIALLLLGLNSAFADVPKVSAQPNPASNTLNIQVSNCDVNSIKIKVYNVLGSEVNGLDLRQLDNKGNFVLNVNPIPDGIYLLTIQSGKDQVTKRIKIQH